MDIIPFVGLGSILFKTSRDDVRNLLGCNVKEFRKTHCSKSLTDYYPDFGVHLYYDEFDKLEFIESFHPCVVSFRGVCMIGADVNSVITEFEKQKIYGRFDGVSWFFDDFGFAIIDMDGAITGVSIFCKGYYG